MKSEIKENDFKVKFDGQMHQIDAQVLIVNLLSLSNAIHEINRELGTGKEIKIKVKALEKGSFLIHIELIESILDGVLNVFNRQNIETTGYIIASIVGIIEIKKHLRGKKPENITVNGDLTIIKNEINQEIQVDSEVYNIYIKNDKINDEVSKMFDVVESEPSIDALEITNRNEEAYVRVEKSDFKDLSIRTDVLTENKREITEVVRLNIVRISFEENLKWDFYWRGNKISARIIDPRFHILINEGEAFAKGDTLEAELKIHQVLDESVSAYVNKSFQVSKIIQHFKRGHQHSFDFDSENDEVE